MKQKLPYYTAKTLKYLKEDMTDERYAPVTMPKWVLDYEVMEEESIEVDLPVLDPKDNGLSAERLYKALEHLTPIQARDERIWAALTHRHYWEYTKQRWSGRPGRADRPPIDAFFLGQGSQQALLNNALTRLWWGYRLVKDADPEITRAFFKGSDFQQSLMEHRYGGNASTVIAFVQEAIRAGRTSSLDVQAVARMLNAHGGARNIDDPEVRKQVLVGCLASL